MHRVNAHRALAEEVWYKFANCKQTLGLAICKGLEEHGIDYRENGRVGAEADRKREDRNGGKATVPVNSAEGITEVLPESINEWKPALIAVALLCRFDAAELKLGLATGLVGRDTTSHVFFREELYVGFELLGKFALVPLGREASE
jgi:hypothetical protein